MAERDLREIAAIQHGFFRADQARASGLSYRYLARARERGVIVSVRHGLYRFAQFPSDPDDHLHEIAVLAPGAVFSHATALAIHGLFENAPRKTHLSVSPESGLKDRPELEIHRTRLGPDEWGVAHGLRVTSIARTLRDAARAGVDPRGLRAAFRDARRTGRLTETQALSLLEMHPYSLERTPAAGRTGTGVARTQRPLAAGDLPDWETLLLAAARLQGLLPGSTLVGGTAAALIAQHRRSDDADHVLAGLRERFDEVLEQLEAAAGWRTARVQSPVVIKGRLDGILTTVRNLMRSEPLEVQEIATEGGTITLPTPGEMLRIKAYLVITRNTVRDFLDVAALSDTIGIDASLDALASLDRLYPQDGDRGAVRHQLLRQLAGPHPIEEEAGVELDMSEYKDIDPRWASWSAVTARCLRLSVAMGEAVAGDRDGWRDLEVAP